MRAHSLLTALVPSLIVAGCGSSSTGGSPPPDSGAVDSSIPVVDATPDTGQDTGAPPSDAGEASASDASDAGDGGPMCTPVVADASTGAQWCTVSPSPVASQVDGSAMYGFAANDIWAVSDGGLILHYDGTSWTTQNVGTFDLNAIWGGAPNDIWITGDGGTLLHYDGTSWTKVPTNTQLSLGWVWGSSTDDVWIVGDQGTVMHYSGPDSGTGWVPVDVPVPTQFTDGGVGPVGDGDSPIDLGAVWTDAPNDVWIVGDAGVILHFDGMSWTVTPSNIPTYKGVNGIWGSGPHDVWATADCTATGLTCMGSTLLHWDGTSWSLIPNFPGTYDLGYVWGLAANDVWITSDYGGLYHYDGTSWTPSPTPTKIASWNALWGADPQHVWVIGDLGLILEEVP
jgi:photosystem II stability/assembly factor-like uncharacterized protein